MAEIGQVHDHFFKTVLARTEVVADFLAHYLPREVSRKLDLTSVEPRKDSFVDPDVREHLTDLLYHVRLRTGDDAHVYVLFEHKSAPDGLVALQLLRLLVCIWDEALECLKAVLQYVSGASDMVATEDLDRAAAAALPVAGGAVMPTLAEQWIEEGRQEGRQEGLLAGMGPALETLFGPDGVALLAELREIEDVDVLRKVADAIRTARTVEDLRRLWH